MPSVFAKALLESILAMPVTDPQRIALMKMYPREMARLEKQLERRKKREELRRQNPIPHIASSEPIGQKAQRLLQDLGLTSVEEKDPVEES